MRELLRTKGFKITPQRELVFRTFFELGEHVTVDELYRKVRNMNQSVGYSTVWRNLKLICKVGLAEEVNLGDGLTRYDRITQQPHGHFYCLQCKSLVEFDMDGIADTLYKVAKKRRFGVEGIKLEIHGYCQACRKKQRSGKAGKDSGRTLGQNL